MKRRYLYVVLFGVPILLASALAALAMFAMAAGLTWIFVAGDNPWPPALDTVLTAVAALTFFVTMVALVLAALGFGRRQEGRAALDPRHVWIAAGSTGVLLLAVVSWQWRIGNLGPKPDSVLCSEYCVGKGYAGSGMPPRNSGEATCSCFDAQGREAVTVPIGSVSAR